MFRHLGKLHRSTLTVNLKLWDFHDHPSILGHSEIEANYGMLAKFDQSPVFVIVLWSMALCLLDKCSLSQLYRQLLQPQPSHLLLYIKVYWTTDMLIIFYTICSCFQLPRVSEIDWSWNLKYLLSDPSEKSFCPALVKRKGCMSEIKNSVYCIYLCFLFCFCF